MVTWIIGYLILIVILLMLVAGGYTKEYPKSVKWAVAVILALACVLGWLNTADAEVMRIGKYGKIVNTEAQLQTKVLTASDKLAPATKDFTAKVEASNYTAFSDKATGKVRFDDGKDWLIMSVRDIKGLTIDYKSTQWGMKEYITVAEKADVITIIYDIESSCTQTKWKDDGTLVFINPTTGNDIALAKPFVLDQDAKVTATYDKGVYTLVVDAKELKFPVVIDPSINADDTDDVTGHLYRTNADYNAARNIAAAQIVNNTQLYVGQVLNGSGYKLSKSLVRVLTSSLGSAAVIDSVFYKVPITTDSTKTNFYIILKKAIPELAVTDFTVAENNKFVGWKSSGVYPDSSAVIADSLLTVATDTSSDSLKDDTLSLKFNTIGNTIINKTGTTQFYILSNRFITGTPPVDISTPEYLIFDDDSSYLEIYYHYHGFYVDATEGLDSNDGKSAATAWKTINKVNTSTFAAGDSIQFQCGETWDETLTIPSSGTAALPIVFSSYGTGDKPIIDGSDTRTYGIYASNKSYVTIDGIDIQNMRKDANGYGVYFSGGTGNTVKNCSISKIYYATNPMIGGSSTAWEVLRGYGIAFQNSNRPTITGNTITDIGASGIYVASVGNPLTGITIANNDISNMNVGISLAQATASTLIDSVSIYGNHIHDFNNYYACSAWHRDGIHIWSIYNSAADTIKHVDIYNNYFSDTVNPTGAGNSYIYVEYLCQNFKIHHNIFDSYLGAYCIRFKGRIGYPDYGGHMIANNTMSTSTSTIYLGGSSADSIYNNIIYLKNAGVPMAVSVGDLYSMTDFAFSNNIIYPVGAPTADIIDIYTPTRTRYNATEAAAASINPNGYYIYPLFAGGTGATAFKLSISGTDTSTAIDNGANLSFTTDYQDTTIPQGAAPDIGAFEYPQAPGSPNSPTDVAETHRATHATITWTPAAGNDSTKIYVSINGGTDTWVDSKYIDTGTITIRNLSAGNTYLFKLKTRKGTGATEALSGESVVSYIAPRYILGRIR